MKRRMISLLLALALLLTVLPTTALVSFATADTNFNGLTGNNTDSTFTGTYASGSSYSFSISYTMDYTDFFGTNTVYNQHIADLSLWAAQFCYDDSNVTYTPTSPASIMSDSGTTYSSDNKVDRVDEFMDMHGMNDIIDWSLNTAQTYTASSKTLNLPGYTDDDVTEVFFGHHEVEHNGQKVEVIAIFVRGTNASMEEWCSNFDVGDLNRFGDDYDSVSGKSPRQSNSQWRRSTNHRGFDVCANRILDALDEYIANYTDNTATPVYWVSGHSRGAAIANIEASYLVDRGAKVFAYTYASPYTTANLEASAAKYDCIFNVVNADDFVTMLPMPEWGFTRYGRTYSVSADTLSGFRSEILGNTSYSKPEAKDLSDLCNEFVEMTVNNAGVNEGWYDAYRFHCYGGGNYDEKHDHANETMGEYRTDSYRAMGDDDWSGYDQHLKKYSYGVQNWEPSWWQASFVDEFQICQTPAYALMTLASTVGKAGGGTMSAIGAAWSYYTSNKLADRYDFDKNRVFGLTSILNPHYMENYYLIQKAMENQAADAAAMDAVFTASPGPSHYTQTEGGKSRPIHTHTYEYVLYAGARCAEPRSGYKYCTACQALYNAQTAANVGDPESYQMYFVDTVRDVTVPHTWGTPSYEWTVSGEPEVVTCTGSAACTRSGCAEVLRYSVNAAVTNHDHATGKYEASADFSGAPVSGVFTDQTFNNYEGGAQAGQSVESHSYSITGYEWSDDKSDCVATLTCSGSGHASHTVAIHATVTGAVTTAPTCTAAGVRTYTATFVNDPNNPYDDGLTTQTETESVAALGHTPDYAHTYYTWSGETSCTAEQKCSVCGVTLSSESTDDITFYVDYDRPMGVYTAHFTNFEPTSKDVENPWVMSQETRADDDDPLFNYTGAWGTTGASAHYLDTGRTGANGTAHTFSVSSDSKNDTGAASVSFDLKCGGFRIYADSSTGAGLVTMDIRNHTTGKTTRRYLQLYRGAAYHPAEGDTEAYWSVDTGAPAYYRIPVFDTDSLSGPIESTHPEGQTTALDPNSVYTVTLTPVYLAAFDMDGVDGYTFTFDGITVLDPYNVTPDYTTTSFRDAVLGKTTVGGVTTYNGGFGSLTMSGMYYVYFKLPSWWLVHDDNDGRGAQEVLTKLCYFDDTQGDSGWAEVEPVAKDNGETVYAARLRDIDNGKAWEGVVLARWKPEDYARSIEDGTNVWDSIIDQTENFYFSSGNYISGITETLNGNHKHDVSGSTYALENTNRFYYRIPTGFWSDGAKLRVCYQGAGKSDKWESFTSVSGDLYYTAKPGAGYDKAIVVRYANTWNETSYWENFWNQTKDIYLGDHNLITVLNYQDWSDGGKYLATLGYYTSKSLTGGAMISGVADNLGMETQAYLELLDKHGPQNMLYLAPDQAIIFRVSGSAASSNYIGLKALNATAGAKIAVYTLNSDNSATRLLEQNISSYEDQYYALTNTELNGKAVIVYNPGSVPLALTRLRTTNAVTVNFNTAVTRRSIRALREIQDGTLIPIEDGTRYIAGHSITLEGDIGVNFYLDLTAEQAETAAVSLRCNGAETEVSLKDARPVQGGSMDGKYKVTARVAAKEMTEGVFAELFLDGVSAEKDAYTVARYAYTLLDNENGAFDGAAKLDELQELCRAMLRYGSESQELFGYKTDYPADVDLDGAVTAALSAEEIASLGDSEAPDLSDYGLEYYGSSLILESETTYRQYFTVAEGDAYESLAARLGDRSLPCGEKDGMFYVDIDGISASEITSSFPVRFGTVEDGAFTETHTGSFTPGAYIRQALDEGDAQLGRTVTALYRYNRAAMAYFN